MRRWEIDREGHTPAGLLRQLAATKPDHPYLDFSGETYTFGQAWNHTQRLARGLRSLGVERGDRVLCMLDNSIDGVGLWLGANLLGAVWIGANTALRGDFLRHVVADADAKIIVCEPDFADRVLGLGDGITEATTLLVRAGAETRSNSPQLAVRSLNDFRIDGPDEPWTPQGLSDISLLVYTGGTTGPSKGCIISNGYVVNIARGFLQQTERREDEVNWNPLPMFHLNVLATTIVGSLLVGGTASIAPRFSVSGFWPEIERTGARLVNLLGSMSAMLAAAPDNPAMARCRGMIRMLHAVPVPPEVEHIWRERFGVRHAGAHSYGMTEAFPITSAPPGSPCPPESAGQRNEDFDVRILDDEGSEVGPGERGEVVCRPRKPHGMFLGYWRRPDATIDATRDLWFRTGDLGMFDDDGFFYFVDRKKDYLRRRGENISSQELERVFSQHPAIDQVAVHAVRSELTEDDVKVTAVLAPGAELAPRELFEWSVDQVPYFALPRYIEFRASLPLSPLGRVHKFQLRDEGCTPDTWDREKDDVTWQRR
jgi:crotonobetaine/carnitine-CoA ligase